MALANEARTMPTTANPKTSAARTRRWWLAAGAAALCAACAVFWFGIEHNRFPVFYHIDEERKVEQVIEGWRNLFHPLLMIESAEALWRAQGASPRPVDVAIAGRTASAFYSALATACLVFFAWHTAGWIAGVLTGLMLVFQPLPYELAHYMKEDPALCFGFAAWVLANSLSRANPSPRGWAAIGGTAALALSGKYIGVIAPLFSLVHLAVNFARKTAHWRSALAFLLALAGVAAAINYKALLNPGIMVHGVSREVHLAVQGSHGMSRSIPHFDQAQLLGREFSGWVWPAVAVCVFMLCLRQRRTWGLVCAFALFACYFGCLSVSSKVSDRYLLPLVFLIAAFAGIGAAGAHAWLRGILPGRFAPWAALLIPLVFFDMTIWQQRKQWKRYRREFKTDMRADLADWINEHVPQGARILQSRHAGLPATDAKFPGDERAPLNCAISTLWIPTDSGSLESLRNAGYTHVLLDGADVGRIKRGAARTTEAAAAELERRAAFLDELQSSGALLWRRSSGRISALSPGLEFYSITTQIPARQP